MITRTSCFTPVLRLDTLTPLLNLFTFYSYLFYPLILGEEESRSTCLQSGNLGGTPLGEGSARR
jgi:hypothetical protein